MRTRCPLLRTLPSSRYRTPSSRPICLTSAAWPLYANVEFRAITKNHRRRDNAEMMSSVIASLKYSCAGSPDMFVKGITAIEGLSGSRSAAAAGDDTPATSCLPDPSDFPVLRLFDDWLSRTSPTKRSPLRARVRSIADDRRYRRLFGGRS